MQFWLDTIKWHPDEYFYHPDMVFWLRNSVQRAQAGVTAGNFALCSGPVLPAGAIEIGEMGHVLAPGARASIQSALSLGEAIPAITVEQVVERIAVNWTDPTGLTRCKPVRVGRGMRLRFKIGDVVVNRQIQPTDSEWLNTLAVERLAYAEWRTQARVAAQALRDAGRTWEQVLEHRADHALEPIDINLLRMGAPDQHLRNLDYLQAKYGRDYREFLGGLPDEGVRPHETTVAENFDGADKAGVGYQLTWTEYVGTAWENLSNAAADNTNHGAANAGVRADSDLSTDGHYAQATLASVTEVTGNQRTGVQVRKNSTATDTHYCFLAAMNNNNWQIWEITGGSDAQLATGGSSPVAGNILKGQADGSSLTLYVGGASTVTFTDTSITGNLRCGLFAQSNDAGDLQSWDDFEAADLAAADPEGSLLGGKLLRGGLLRHGVLVRAA